MTAYKILVVDDVIEQLKTICRIIEKHHPSYKIFQVKSAEMALNLIKNITPDVILSDWEMPEMSGIELVNAIKSNNETKNIPVIIVSGIMTDTGDLKTALENGAMDYIRKPIDEIELLARMHSALTLSEIQKQIIREKENKIAEHLLFANEVNNFLNNIIQNINTFNEKALDSRSLKAETTNLISDIEKKIKGAGWHDYSKAFNNLHPEFTRKLLQNHPDLTPTEIEICKMSRLGLSVKELANLMYVTPESMRVTRSRLRKKLKLQSDQNLQIYLASL